jgi:hypothetical protein
MSKGLHEAGKDYTSRYPKEVLGSGKVFAHAAPSIQETAKKIPSPLNYKARKK